MASGCHIAKHEGEVGDPPRHRNISQELAEKSLKTVVQVAEEDIENLVETTFKLRVEERIPWCYKRGLQGHICAACSPLPGKAKEKESEKVVDAPLPKNIKRARQHNRRPVPASRGRKEITKGKQLKKRKEKGTLYKEQPQSYTHPTLTQTRFPQPPPAYTNRVEAHPTEGVTPANRNPRFPHPRP